MPTVSKTAQQLAQEKKAMYEQQMGEQARLAREQSVLQTQALQRQLQQQRQNYQGQQQQIQMSAQQRQQNLLRQTASRGLSGSGLSQLAGVQSQMQTGSDINQAAQTNAQVQQAGMDANAGIARDLYSRIQAAQMQKTQGVIGADETLYGQEQATQENDFQRGLAYMDALGVDPASTEGKALLAQLFGGVLPAEMATQVEAAATDPLADAEGWIKGGNGVLGQTAEGIAAGIFSVSALSGKGNIFYKPYTEAEFQQEVEGERGNTKRNYTIDGVKMRFNMKEVVDFLKNEKYASSKSVQDGTVRITTDTGGNVWFMYGDNKYKSLRAAETAAKYRK